ncbi:HAD family phosphatase [Eggerthellaceae bacterium zg-1084]|uniref:HAD family hydrolase n=1 Tax=Berryella wangjianweii TaxID=2734634 RepID=UPI00155169FD|nr:HAD-IA family hydrolase [Berryella wangjianweii]NPD30871.1 HAD family phosphatase [Berryella wangjianweii]
MTDTSACSACGVVFDCDGTLLDTIDAWHRAEAHVAQQAGVSLSRADRDVLNTLTLPEAAAFFHERFGVGDSAPQVAERIEEFMMSFYRTQCCERPGALAFVRGLRQAGVRMVVASSSPRAFIQAGLERCGFLPYLDGVVSVDDVEGSKRDPFIYRHCCELMGVEPERAWGFDDSAYAVAAMTELGMRCVGVYSSPLCGSYVHLARHARFVIQRFDELDPAVFAQRMAEGAAASR